MPKDLALAVGAILVVVGLVQTGVALFEWLRERRLARSGIETIGRVVASTPVIVGDETTSHGYFRFFAEFIVDGVHYRVLSKFHAATEREFLDTDEAILYDPGDPKHARFKRDELPTRNVLWQASCIAVGIGLIVYGLW